MEFTKERLLKIQSWSETYGPGSNVVLPAEEAEGLAHIALDAQAAGPVYQWRERYVDSYLWDDCTKEQYEGFTKRPDVETRILYTAPPAPVTLPTFEEWCKRTEQNPVGWVRDTMKEAYDACRAAMLHGADGNSPVIPDGWVACSERMPDVGDVVLTAKDGFVNVGEMERSGANYRYFTSIASGRELPATHWQPLPAAPQQESE